MDGRSDRTRLTLFHLTLIIMTLLAQQTAAVEAITDSTVTHVEERINDLAHMPVQDIIDNLTNWVITFGKNLLIALVVYFIGRWLIRHLKKLIHRILEKKQVDPSLSSFIMSLTKIILNLFLIIVLIGILGIDTTSFIAVFASAGLAFGMALSGTLQNFAGGVMILIFKPYKVGDTIEAQGYSGVVKEIQLISTIINTPDNKTILIPNGNLSTGIINNYSREGRRRVEWTFGIAYGDNYDLARETILTLIQADPRIQPDPAPFIALKELADSSVNLVVRAWVSTDDYWNVYFDLNEKVYKVFSQKGINIPFPQMDVYLHPSENPTATSSK